MLDDLVERRIREARERGEFDNLPGQGKPLVLDDDALIPEDLRVALRILKNAGFVPPEVEALRSLTGLVDQTLASADPQNSRRAQRRLLALELALENAGLSLSAGAAIRYRQALQERLGQQRATPSDAGQPPAPAIE